MHTNAPAGGVNCIYEAAASALFRGKVLWLERVRAQWLEKESMKVRPHSPMRLFAFPNTILQKPSSCPATTKRGTSARRLR